MPKVKTLQIVWHEKEPVYSVDFHPDGTLATAGADKEIKLWQVSREEDGCASVKHMSTLQGHAKTVNCVRFSPSGNHLVSSGDSGELLLWAPQAADAPRGNLVSLEETSAEWRRAALLRGHTDDVMDLAWAADGSALLSGSIDNKAIVWEISEKRRGAMLTQFASHKHFVQGVAWDPAQQFAITQSADRTCKVYALRPPPAGRRNKVSQYLQPACATAKEFYCAHTLSKRILPPPTGEAHPAAVDAKSERHPLFLDESIPSFFRRPAWSPDGSFLVLPAGMQRSHGSSKEVNTAYLYARGKWAAPVAHLPAQTKPVVAVRFCPTIFRCSTKDSATAPAPFDRLPYKMVFAVATLDSVIIYDTSSALPLAVFGQLHYDSITDLAWSKDGQYLAIASRDCYCSIAVFQPEELGEPLPIEELPAHVAKRMAGQDVESPPPQPAKVASAEKPQSATMPAGAAPAAAAAALQAVPSGGGSGAPAPVSVTVKKRIVPEMMAAPPSAPLAVQADASLAAPSAKKPKRITPALVQPLPAAVNAGDVSDAEKAHKRITPTPLASIQPQGQFEKVQAVVNARPVEPSPAAVPPSGSHRRITPVAVVPPPAQTEPASTSAAAAAPAAPKAKLGMSIAAMAMAAGQQAAEKNNMS